MISGIVPKQTQALIVITVFSLCPSSNKEKLFFYKVLRHLMPCEPSFLYTGFSHTPVKSHCPSRFLLFSFDSFPSHVLLYPLYFPLSVRALSINDGLGSMSAAIEQCVLTFFLALTCLPIQFTVALLWALAIFFLPPHLLLSPFHQKLASSLKVEPR